MGKEIFQIVYVASKDNPDDFHPLFKEEALAMREVGFLVDIKPMTEATQLMYRGTSIILKNDYPKDKRYINTAENCIHYLYLSKYYPLIKEICIDTFFEYELGENVENQIIAKGWGKAFIKKEITALEHIEEGKSIWPNTSLEEMKKLYNEMQIEGKYAIRKFIEKDIIDQEDRYWVLNGNIYHRHNKVPDVVTEAAKRLNKLGSRYYTIDATPDFIVEINPGESSDRHAVNSAELFASWFKKEFVL